MRKLIPADRLAAEPFLSVLRKVQRVESVIVSVAEGILKWTINSNEIPTGSLPVHVAEHSLTEAVPVLLLPEQFYAMAIECLSESLAP